MAALPQQVDAPVTLGVELSLAFSESKAKAKKLSLLVQEWKNPAFPRQQQRGDLPGQSATKLHVTSKKKTDLLQIM